MLDIQLIREKPEEVRVALAAAGSSLRWIASWNSIASAAACSPRSRRSRLSATGSPRRSDRCRTPAARQCEVSRRCGAWASASTPSTRRLRQTDEALHAALMRSAQPA